MRTIDNMASVLSALMLLWSSSALAQDTFDPTGTAPPPEEAEPPPDAEPQQPPVQVPPPEPVVAPDPAPVTDAKVAVPQPIESGTAPIVDARLVAGRSTN